MSKLYYPTIKHLMSKTKEIYNRIIWKAEILKSNSDKPYTNIANGTETFILKMDRQPMGTLEITNSGSSYSMLDDNEFVQITLNDIFNGILEKRPVIISLAKYACVELEL
ncbi:MAG: hypothetical protein KAI88_05180 [Nitrosomonadaceae bacterium]|nr:hypothetical protein [Nitrosomonadaceae bacterium]